MFALMKTFKPSLRAHFSIPLKLFHTSGLEFIKANKLPPRPKVNEDEITEVFLKGGRGPGGQKINKCNSKVQLKHLPTGIVVTCQATRSREQNRKKAREILGMKIEHFYDPENSRKSVLVERKHNIKENKYRKNKKKYEKLEEEKILKDEAKKKEEEDILATLIDPAQQMIKPSGSN
ncbi:hypothetical protein WICMUC_001066 [Wickerhamomyces mucosus]|uniref:Prokaryotic-type class I peptide chain release factors domain-containing protein n=1 Tax=Wickerhamomyces mucosus TaxID=1378264 RepID=A0A9P8TI86_9ASCO|nr:hypothetical protein WICMUC_001066 [Wickerhamomyces mucosus]